MQKSFELNEYYFGFHKNLVVGSFDFAEQLSLNKESQVHLTKVPKLRSKVTDRVIEKKSRVRKLLGLHEYYFSFYKNLDVGRFNLAEQLYLSTKRRFYLIKVVKLRSEVETGKK